jgi:hypothetical protein
MERPIEWFVAVTALIVGVSHLLQPGAWIEFFRQLHGLGKPGAFVNGALSPVPGAVIVAGHGVWTWPGVVLTAFGWLLVVKGAVCLLAPEVGLRSMERVPSRAGFMAGGAVVLGVAGWAGYCLCRGGGVSR